MPEHIIKFSIPEEQIELNITLNAFKYKNILYEYDQYLRNLIKYDSDMEVYKQFSPEVARTRLWELINEENIDIND